MAKQQRPSEPPEGPRTSDSIGLQLLPETARHAPVNVPAWDARAERQDEGEPHGEAVSSTLLALESIVAGRYRVLRLLGLGGMSEVYEAWDMERETACALKVLRLQHRRSDKLRIQMAAEARALIELCHPNIVAVWDAGVTEEGLIYFAMELLSGSNLLDAIYGPADAPRRGFVPLRDALDWMVQLAGAIHALHLSGIIHRDIKPENIFVTREGCVKVLDLGAAKFRRYGLRTTGAHKTIGTPPYMSPEHLRGDPSIDGRADVYSLGHVYYETLAKRHAFCGPGESYNGETYRMWQEQRRPASLLSVRPSLPSMLDDIVFKALEKRREDRFLNAELLQLATLGAADLLACEGRLDEPPEVPREVREAQRLAAATTAEAVPGKPADLPFVNVNAGTALVLAASPEEQLPQANVRVQEAPLSEGPTSPPASPMRAGPSDTAPLPSHQSSVPAPLRRTVQGTEIIAGPADEKSVTSSSPPRVTMRAGRHGTIPLGPPREMPEALDAWKPSRSQPPGAPNAPPQMRSQPPAAPNGPSSEASRAETSVSLSPGAGADAGRPEMRKSSLEVVTSDPPRAPRGRPARKGAAPSTGEGAVRIALFTVIVALLSLTIAVLVMKLRSDAAATPSPATTSSAAATSNPATSNTTSSAPSPATTTSATTTSVATTSAPVPEETPAPRPTVTPPTHTAPPAAPVRQAAPAEKKPTPSAPKVKPIFEAPAKTAAPKTDRVEDRPSILPFGKGEP